MPVIGYLHFAKPEYTPNAAEFLQGLGERGFVEGKNVALEYRWAEGQYDRLPAMAAELVARKVDLIAAFGPPPARAAKNATSAIPIVFEVGNDAVEAGLVESLARPGGNATGLSILFTQLTPKRLDPFFDTRRAQLVAPAAQFRVPTIYFEREFAAVGGLISYGSSLPAVYRQMGIYAAKILKGEKPSELPVEQPTKFELIINLKTAKALGLTVPAKLMFTADEVIE